MNRMLRTLCISRSILKSATSYGLATIIGTLTVAAAPFAAEVPQPNAPSSQPSPITITTESTADAIGLISGGQFEFFSPPIVSRSSSEPLLNSWKSASLRLLRFPGGTCGDHYIWNDPSAGHFLVGNAKSVLTPAKFIEMCRATGADPIFQVNAMSVDRTSNRINPNDLNAIRNGAKRAAEWVQNANIQNKWNVKYWEIGNEVWIWLSGKEYARYVAEYSKAMKAVDPQIQIIACGLNTKVGPFDPHSFFDFSKTDPTWVPRTNVVNEPEEWNEALLSLPAGTFDYIAPHPYISAAKRADSRSMYLETLAKIAKNEGMETQYRLLNKHPESKVQIAITEWACNFNYSVPGSSGKIPPEEGYYYTLGNGVNMAYYYGRLLENSKNRLAIMHSLCDLQTLYYWPKKEMAADAPLEHPAFLAMRIWGSHTGSTRMKIQTSSEPGLLSGTAATPSLYLFASEDDNARYLVAINLDPDHTQSLLWKSTGAEAVQSLLSGDSLGKTNFADWGKAETSVSIQSKHIAESKGGFPLQLPPHSVSGVRIAK